jgi:hypothetical protein
MAILLSLLLLIRIILTLVVMAGLYQAPICIYSLSFHPKPMKLVFLLSFADEETERGDLLAQRQRPSKSDRE